MPPKLDESYVFVFLRQDQFNWEQLVASVHTSLELAWDIVQGTPLKDLQNFRPVGHPHAVVVGVPDEEALTRVGDELIALGLEFRVWIDPDEPEKGRTGLATMPMSKQARNKLHKYRPWSERNNKHAKGEG